MSVGIKEVARAAGVSTATVSHYLNKPETVRPETGARVQRAIDDLDYVRNAAASQLRRGESRMLAFVAFDISDPHFVAVARGAREAAAAEGLSLVLADTQGVAETEADYLDLFHEQRVRGVLLSPSGNPSDLAIERIRSTPIVLVDREDARGRTTSVAIDNLAGGRAVGAHFVQLGRRRPAFVGGPLDVGQVADRLAGMRSAMEGALDRDILVLSTSQRNVRAGRAVAQELLAMDHADRPDAIFAVNDLVALGLLHTVLADGRWRVPDDVAIVGFNDTEADEYSIMPLTSVRVGQEEMGRTAVEVMLTSSSGRLPLNVRLQPELVVRESSTRSVS